MWVTYFFVSGLAYFVGAGLTCAAAAGDWTLGIRGGRPAYASAGLAGAVVALLSATPSPWWLYAMWLGSSLVWLILSRSGRPGHARVRHFATAAAIVLSMIAVLQEWPYQRNPHWPRSGYKRLCVVGDSISAGLGTPQEGAWPQRLAAAHGIDVANLSVAGADVRGALGRVPRAYEADSVVLVEIGGNDLLRGTPVTQFEDDLGSLLGALCGPRRLVVMMELPLPPFCNEYGAAQRRMARAHDVGLLPKRHFARVLATSGATIDGLHLSDMGSRLMADRAWTLLRDLFQANPE